MREFSNAARTQNLTPPENVPIIGAEPRNADHGYLEPMTKPALWLRLAAGLCLGVAVAFLIGCVHAYTVWDPPSNDWGNAKSSATLLLSPLFVVVIAVALLARRAIRRGLARLRGIGRVGILAALAGAAILPAAERGAAAVERGRVTASLATERAAGLATLSAIGARLRQADAVVLENQAWLSRTDFDRLVPRLSAFIDKPVFVAEDDPGPSGPGRDRPGHLRLYRSTTGADCPATPDGRRPDSCLTQGEIVDFGDWPMSGVVLTIDRDWRPMDDGKTPYVTVTVGALVKPAAAPTSPYALPYDPWGEPKTTWANACVVTMDGPFPFGGGIDRPLCVDPLTLDDAATQIFAAPIPAGR